MITLALTGGIATGKSTFAQDFLGQFDGSVLFDCDRHVHQLLTSPDVARMISSSLGSDLLDSSGVLSRVLLRERVFGDPEKRRTLEGILHPMVREACGQARQQALASPEVRCFVADVPLLYESGFPLPRDLEIVVACGPVTQRQRLMSRNGFSPELAERILGAQLPVPHKAARADAVLWNGGSRAALSRQITHFSLWLKSKFRI